MAGPGDDENDDFIFVDDETPEVDLYSPGFMTVGVMRRLTQTRENAAAEAYKRGESTDDEASAYKKRKTEEEDFITAQLVDILEDEEVISSCSNGDTEDHLANYLQVQDNEEILALSLDEEDAEYFECLDFVGGLPVQASQEEETVLGDEEEAAQLREASDQELSEIDRPGTSSEDPQPSTSRIESEKDNLLVNDGTFYSVKLRKTRKINVREVRRKTFGKNLVEERVYDVIIDDSYRNQTLRDNINELKDMFEDLIGRMRENRSPRDLGRIFIDSSNLHIPILVGPLPVSELSWTSVYEEIERRLNSNETLSFDEGFRIHIGVAYVHQGGTGARPMLRVQGPGNCRISKRSVKYISNGDLLCFARCCGVMRALFAWNEARKDGNPAHRQLKTRYKKISDNRLKFQKDEAEQIQRDMVGLALDQPVSIADIPLFEQALGYRIIVVEVEKLNKIVYRGSIESDKIMYVLLTNPPSENTGTNTGVGHFDLILGISGFLGKENFCDKCLRSCGRKHRCIGQCNTCDSIECQVVEGEERRCSDCNRRVRSDSCFVRHKDVRENMKSLCDSYHQCIVCFKVYESCESATHQCGAWHCKRCDEDCLPSGEKHVCHMRATAPKKVSHDYIGIDFECDINGPTHVPIYAAAVWCCKKCIDTPHVQSSQCQMCGDPCIQCSRKKLCMTSDSCGRRVKTFHGENAAEDMGRWLFSKDNAGKTVFAHNLSGYDGFFILNYLTEQGLNPKVIFRGSKILQIHLQQTVNIRLIDTLSFLPMRLADMPKAFNLQAVSKGYFPHFNFTDREYIGPMPPAHCYGPDQMRKKDRDEFFRWYQEEVENNSEFDFRRDIEKYCVQDCFIMFEAAMKFRHEMLHISKRSEDLDGCDPWSYITLPSLCQAIFKSKFLHEYHDVMLGDGREVRGIKKSGKLYVQDEDGVEEDSADHDIESSNFVNSPIILAPPGGLTGHDTFSRVSLEWLEWVAHTRDIQIKHALNGGEHRIPNSKGSGQLRMDGFHLDETTGVKTCYSFHGCIWHGCKTCFPTMRERRIVAEESEELKNDNGPSSWRHLTHPYTNQSMAELHALTLARKEFIQSQGYDVVEMWECQWTRMKVADITLNEFVGKLSLVDRLRPKDAFFGGRTNCTKFFYETAPNEKISYLDFCSLYPFILKNRPLPIFSPSIITDNFSPLESYYGLAKVKVLPPRNLYIPVLPVRMNGKLLFPLCHSCAIRESQTICNCTDEERMLIGTWATPELEVALEKGYVVLNIYEVYHWDRTSVYSPQTRSGGLFAAYIDEFLKLKVESSGWPSWCETNTQKEDYILQYERREGIQLNGEKIEVNPAKRAVAKLCLNSLWGRFAMRENMGSTSLITTDDEYFDLLCNPAHVLKDFHPINDKILHVEYRLKEGMEECNGSTNIFIALFTTMYARLHLFTVLDALAERVLYFDTDSVIFSSKDGDWEPPVGDFLGDLQSELKPDEFITRFVSGGPKNYGYVTNKGNVVCKVRGFTLNYENSLRVNMDSMIELVLNTVDVPDERPTIMTTMPSKIVRNKKSYTIKSRKEDKLYSMRFSKRVRVPGTYDSIPYGFRK